MEEVDCVEVLAVVLLAMLVAEEAEEVETGVLEAEEAVGRAVEEEALDVDALLGFATDVLVAGLLEEELVLTFVLLTGVVALGLATVLEELDVLETELLVETGLEVVAFVLLEEEEAGLAVEVDALVLDIVVLVLDVVVLGLAVAVVEDIVD